MLLREVKTIFHNELNALYPKEEINSFFYLLIEHYFNLERFVLAMQPSYVIAKEEEQLMFNALAKLRLQKPIQHIIGIAHFMGMDFSVNENVLIPRPETEGLVQWIIDEVQNSRGGNVLRILDIGTGSGCIAISLAKQLSNTKIYALDVSPQALEVAKKNAVDNGVTVQFIKSDIFKINTLNSKFDILVSNPPYIRMLEKQQMKANVLENEPHMALFVPDDDPLLFYKRITAFASENLNVNGRLFFEINQYLGKETQQLLSDHNFSEIELRKDMYGADRMLMGKIL